MNMLASFRLLSGLATLASATVARADHWVYFGAYTGAKSKGIVACRLNNDGRLTPVGVVAEVANPTYLAVHPSGKFLYAISEVGKFGPKATGFVSAYAVDASTGRLTALNEQSSGGPGPCHLDVDRGGRCVVLANYGGGSVAALPIKSDGSLGEPGAFFQHEGSSVNQTRQAGPHAHCIVVDPSQRFALACDLGLDKVLVYQLDAAHAKLTPHVPAFAAVAAGSGPRHLAFHPNGRFAYVISELRCTMTAFEWNRGRGTLQEIQTLSTLPGEQEKTFSTAEVAVHQSGKFVYGSNRGHDSIVAYACNLETGRLTLIGHQSTQGNTPRHFAIDPSGRFLLAENQATDDVVVFRIEAQSGRLAPTGQKIAVGSPVCAVFVAVK